MKICVYKASNLFNEEIREFPSLEEAVNTLLKDETFGGGIPELIISKPREYSSTLAKKCDFMIELYDEYRE